MSVTEKISAEDYLLQEFGKIDIIPFLPELAGQNGMSFDTYDALNRIAAAYSLETCPTNIIPASDYDFAFMKTPSWACYTSNNDRITIRNDTEAMCVSSGTHELVERHLRKTAGYVDFDEMHRAALLGQTMVSVTSQNINLLQATHYILLNTTEPSLRALEYLSEHQRML